MGAAPTTTTSPDWTPTAAPTTTIGPDWTSTAAPTTTTSPAWTSTAAPTTTTTDWKPATEKPSKPFGGRASTPSPSKCALGPWSEWSTLGTYACVKHMRRTRWCLKGGIKCAIERCHTTLADGRPSYPAMQQGKQEGEKKCGHEDGAPMLSVEVVNPTTTTTSPDWTPTAAPTTTTNPDWTPTAAPTTTTSPAWTSTAAPTTTSPAWTSTAAPTTTMVVPYGK